MKCAGIIPARYASTRFPGKPLALINGTSMIRRVYEQCLKSASLNIVVVATDNEEIAEHVRSFNGKVIMTSTDHRSGTDRCNEALNHLLSLYPEQQYDVVVNIQGDEPFIDPAQIDAVTACFKDEHVDIATLARPIDTTEELFNPNAVKVVRGLQNQALYFSRSTIPFIRGTEQHDWLAKGNFLKHLGLYAYRTPVLKAIAQLTSGNLEILESLEQLRWLENGYRISVELTDKESISIDTPDDLAKLTNSTW
ncbi:MAG: 3-deoxy-manno-octulosonate cytidylyltransferase [Bacteroidetes bacterium]|nr:3-deoxy-manno-octulosonate cytidylyltransferase [Bacteroidota bacterium]